MDKWIHKLIRKIPQPYYTTGVEAAVAHDTDNDRALCFKLYDDEKNIKFGYHFNINWIEKDEKRVDWLAQVLSSALQDAYNKGKQDSEKATSCALNGFKQLLNRV